MEVLDMVIDAANLYENLSSDELIRHSLERKEAVLSSNGALSVTTGNRTGRSPNDRFIVEDEVTKTTIDWGAINKPIASEKFDKLWQRATDYMRDKDAYVSEFRVGASKTHGVPVTVITEYAWHHLFCQNMFIREANHYTQQDSWTLLSVPGFNTDPERDGVNSEVSVLLNFAERKVLLCGARYAGEMKKSMFSALNFLLTDQDILPMHCASNSGKSGDTALFFGLSGTGKTTLSSDPKRFIIGDDEHGWGRDNIFNFEGGCYAKCIDLSEEREPVIFQAIKQGAVMENVALLDDGSPDYSDAQFSQNSRCAYPREHIEKRVESNNGGVPNAVVFLTCDLYGVLPPVAKLDKHQAAYYFLSGYTALVGSTEVGQGAGVKPTFSTCFGAPFFPRRPQVYADLLIKRLEESGADVYLVNTGWTGGMHGQGGKRFSIPITRRVIDAIVSGELKQASYETLPGFNFNIPKYIDGVDKHVLDPELAWENKAAYQRYQRELIEKFQENFQRFRVESSIMNAGPK
jgi:phosphoenolpyruvate carboxykinase (ATP)